MSNSNGMYNVLSIFKKLEPTQEQTIKSEAKAIYESVEAQGSILKGVTGVEKRLSEAFASLKEGEKIKTKKGIVHKGTYGTDYDEEENGSGSGKKPSKPKTGTGKRGRPAKEKPPENSKSNDPFGRVPDKAPSGKTGRKIKGKGNEDDNIEETVINPYAVGMAAAKKGAGLGKKPAHNLPKKVINKAHKIAKKVNEGYNFRSMMDETEMGVEEMLEALQGDIKNFKETGHCSDTLEAFLKIHNHGKRLMGEANPTRGPSFAPQHADIPPAPQKPTSMLGRAAHAVGQGARAVGKAIVGKNDDELLRDLHSKSTMEEDTVNELNELARMAGLDVAEGVDKKEFAKLAPPKDKITYADKIAGATKNESEEKADDDYDNDGKIETGKQEYFGSRRKAAGLDESLEECMSPMGAAASEMGQQQGKINVNTNQSSDGTKNVSITADGDAADQLMQMLKMAGMSGGQSHTKLAIAIPAGGEQEVEMDEAQGEAEYANVPHEEYGSVEQIKDQGDDMNRQKRQDPQTANRAANPLTKAYEEADPMGEMGRKLMREYQSLKIKK